MSVYTIVLFLHVVAAIGLVGGGAWAHVAVAVMKRAETNDSVAGQVGFLHAVVKGLPPIALVVGLAGLYLTFDGDWWGKGWPVVSLVLFIAAGAVAGAVVDPAVEQAKAVVEAAPAGPLSAEVRAAMVNPRLTMATWLMFTADLGIVFMMTNKPGYTGSLLTVLVALVVGAAIGVRENRHAVAGATSAPPATA